MTPGQPAVLPEELIRAAAAAPPVTASSRTDDVPPSWDERTVLTTMLNYVRDTVHLKCPASPTSRPAAPRCPARR